MKEQLLALNEAIRKNEKDGKVDFFELHLAEDLLFRRVKGDLVHKADFIQGLSGRTWETLENREVEVSLGDKNNPGYAVVTLIVDYDFVFNDSPKQHNQGSARNIRFFRLEDGIWKLYAWYNEAAAPKGA